MHGEVRVGKMQNVVAMMTKLPSNFSSIFNSISTQTGPKNNRPLPGERGWNAWGVPKHSSNCHDTVIMNERFDHVSSSPPFIRAVPSPVRHHVALVDGTNTLTWFQHNEDLVITWWEGPS